MKLIDKIIAYCRKVEKAERPKQGDKEEYSHGKYAVASSVLKLVELNQPEPPTLRPMSELPATKSTCATFCNFLVEHNSKNRYYVNGYYFKSEAAGTYACVGDGDTPKQSQGWVFGEHKLIGWLYELPNPNEIKPC
jgi:hypothetical protein